MLNRLFLACTIAIAVALAGCTAIGQQAPKTPEDGLRYAQATLTGIYTTLGQSVAAGALPAADARSIYNRLEPAYKAMADASAVTRALPAGAAWPADAVGKVQFSVAILSTIAEELRRRLPPAQTAALPPPIAR